MLAGWAKGDSAPLDAYDTNPREFSLIATFSNNDFFTSTQLLMGGGGGGSAYAIIGGGACARALDEVVNNTNEAIVQEKLKQDGYAYYNGVLVVMTALPFDKSAATVGVIVMDDYYGTVTKEKFTEILNHEYGHAVHFQKVGMPTYLVTTVFPSLLGAGLKSMSSYVDKNYYSLPTERIADHLGGTNHTYLPGADALAELFWLYTILYPA